MQKRKRIDRPQIKRIARPRRPKKGHHKLQSATAGPSGQLIGMTVWGQQFLGWRFSITAPSRITHIGGHLSADSSGGVLFAAIIKLMSPTSLPAFAPRLITTSPDTLFHLLFVPPLPSGQVRVPLLAPLALQPGTYCLVFGGADTAVAYTPFGATGTGIMPMNNSNLPGSTYFFADQFRWNVIPPPDNNIRFMVEFNSP
jgi:hypothetical protein